MTSPADGLKYKIVKFANEGNSDAELGDFAVFCMKAYLASQGYALGSADTNVDSLKDKIVDLLKTDCSL